MAGRLLRNRKVLFLVIIVLVLTAHFGNIKKYFQFHLDVAVGSRAQQETLSDNIQAEDRGFRFHGRGSQESDTTSAQETAGGQRFESFYSSVTPEDFRQTQITTNIAEESRADNKQDFGKEPHEHLQNTVKVGLPPPHQVMLETSTFTQVPSNGLKNSLRKAPTVNVPSELREEQELYRTPVLKKQEIVALKTFNHDIEHREQHEYGRNFHDEEPLLSPRVRQLGGDAHSNLDHPTDRNQFYTYDEVVTGEPISRNASSISIRPTSEVKSPYSENILSASVILEEEDGDFPFDSVGCPYFRIGADYGQETENVTCVSHKSFEKDCQRAHKFYDLDRKPLKCSTKAQASLCSFKQTWRSSKRDKLTLKCDLSLCGRNRAVHVIALDSSSGTLKDREKWHKFASTKDLERFLPNFVIATSVHGFNFFFLACHSKHKTKEYVEQILYFPPIMGEARNRLSKSSFNVNILVLDSVSRPHFYRTLPKTVDRLREMALADSTEGTNVLDFELFQSSAAHTFQNIRALMSGKTDFGSHQNQTYGIEVLFGKFQRNGYYTLLQEDSCWFDSWGSLFTNNIYQGKKPSNKLEFHERWQSFQTQVGKFFIDDYGLSHTPCEVFRRYNTTNQFNHPKRVCFGGRVFAEFFLDYVESVFVASKTSGNNRSILSYTHLNIGHEVSGSRIRQIDKHLSKFLSKMAKNQDTMTIILSDHGPKTTKYAFHTMAGRREIYNPFLFMIIPEGVARILGKERMQALKMNQRRLLSALDLHLALMSIGDSQEKIPDRPSAFTVIPANRTCADFNLSPSAVCKCQGWEERFSNKDDRFLWMAELGLGTLNNQIQQQYLSGGQNTAGFGKCQRLIGKGIAKVRRRTQGDEYIATMDLLVKPENEIFEIQVRYPKKANGNGVAALSFSQRITIYRHFSRCVDHNVSISLCVCLYDKQKQDRYIKRTQIRSREDVLHVIAESKSFNATIKVRHLHEGCLLLITRKHGPRAQTKVIEASNTCRGRQYSINVSAERVEDVIISRDLPFSLTLLPRTIHFLFSVYHLQKPYDFKVIVSYEYGAY